MRKECGEGAPIKESGFHSIPKCEERTCAEGVCWLLLLLFSVFKKEKEEKKNVIIIK